MLKIVKRCLLFKYIVVQNITMILQLSPHRRMSKNPAVIFKKYSIGYSYVISTLNQVANDSGTGKLRLLERARMFM